MGIFELGTAFQADTLSDQVSPPFLQGPNGSAFLTAAIGAQLDQLRFRSAAAIANRFPLLADPTALYYLGLDRLLTQAVGESSATFATRLSKYISTWRIAGTDWSVLQQVLAQIAPLDKPYAFVVTDTGGWSYYAANANTSNPPHSTPDLANWNWDGSLTAAKGSYYQKYWRCYIGVKDAATWAPAWATLGSGGLPTLGSSGALAGSLGFSTLPATFWATIQNIVQTFHRAGAWFEYIIPIYTNSGYSPDFLSTPTGGNPSGSLGLGYSIVSGAYGPSWPTVTIAPVPLAPVSPPPGRQNSVGPNNFGFRITNGQYLPA